MKTLEEVFKKSVDELPDRSTIEILIRSSGVSVYLVNQNGTVSVPGETLTERIQNALEDAKTIAGMRVES